MPALNERKKPPLNFAAACWAAERLAEAARLAITRDAGEAVGDVVRCGLAIDRGVEGEDDLVRVGLGGALASPWFGFGKSSGVLLNLIPALAGVTEPYATAFRILKRG